MKPKHKLKEVFVSQALKYVFAHTDLCDPTVLHIQQTVKEFDLNIVVVSLCFGDYTVIIKIPDILCMD